MRRWQALLQLCLAGILALILPFVCWGAQATPGHPHAHAHFVFWPPEQAPRAAPPAAFAELMRAAALCGGVAPAADAASAADPGAANVVTPSVLAIFVLLALYLTLILSPQNDAPGFLHWQVMPCRRATVARCDPPPPRVRAEIVLQMH